MQSTLLFRLAFKNTNDYYSYRYLMLSTIQVYLAKYTQERYIRNLFYALLLPILIYMAGSSSSYGICWDDELQANYGEAVYKFYRSGGHDDSYMEKSSQLANQTSGQMHLYGSFFDAFTALVHHVFKDGDRYEQRHFWVAIFGFLGILFTGLAAKEIGNWKTGLMALLLLFFTPIYFGHSMFNTKDIPFAAAYMASVYFIIRLLSNLQSVSWRDGLGFIVFAGITLAIRIGGLMLFLFAGVFLLAKIAVLLYNKKESLASLKKPILRLLLFSALAYVVTLICWPFALTNPITHPLEALTVFSKYQFDSGGLFDGKRPHYWEIPWNYIPLWIYVTTPLFVPIGVVALGLCLPFFKKWFAFIRVDALLMVVVITVFPVVFIILKKSNLYDGWRHALFVYPTLVVVIAVALQLCSKLASGYYKHANVLFTALFGLLLLEPAAFMARNHKLETFYFSPAIGGPQGAWGKFDIDYYGTSIRYAVEWIAANADTLKKGPNGKIRVRCYYGEKVSFEHFANKYKNLQVVYAPHNSLDWDYSIIQPVESKHHDTAFFTHWPPPNLSHEIKVDGAPLIAIEKNVATTSIQNLMGDALYKNNNVNELLNNGFLFFKEGDFVDCVAASERALQLDSNNVVAMNNIGSGLNSLLVFDEGNKYFERALKVKPDFQLAKNNLNIGQQSLAKGPKADMNVLANTYLNLSACYFNLGKYQYCIYYCKKALKIRPADAIAYNNICASNMRLGKLKEAKAAGEKALEIKPDFQLAKNNLQELDAAMKPH